MLVVAMVTAKDGLSTD